MARSNYEGSYDRFAVVELRLIKTKIDRQRQQESSEDIREALRRKSGSEFLREVR